jgi:hypothetical protein
MKMKVFNFLISGTMTGKGYVHAETKEEALEMIERGDWDDIYDTVDEDYEGLIEIDDGEEDEDY